MEVGCAFIGALAESGDYTISTIRNVFLYSLKRLNREYTNEKIPINIVNKMNSLICEYNWDDNVKAPRGGMEPLVVDDVKRIISSIDCWDKMKDSLSSLFIFALSTGTRGFSCGLI